MQDIVTSNLPFWTKTCAWIIARPMSGFSETFSQYVMEVGPAGAVKTRTRRARQGVLFVVDGEFEVAYNGATHRLDARKLRLPAGGLQWTLRNTSDAPARFHWIRKIYEAVPGIDKPEPIIARDQDIALAVMPGTDGALGDDALRRSLRHAPRHAREHRHAGARRGDPVC